MKNLKLNKKDVKKISDKIQNLPYSLVRGPDDCFQDIYKMEETLGNIFIVTVSQWNNINDWKVQKKLSDEDYNDFLKKHKLFIYEKHDWYIKKPNDEECIVVIFDESWNFVTSCKFQKNCICVTPGWECSCDLLSINCYECGEVGTFQDGYDIPSGEEEVYCEDCARYCQTNLPTDFGQ